MSGQPNPNGWWGLHSVFEDSRQEFEAYVSRPPMACPNDGEPLMNAPSADSGTGIELYCRYCFWQYPRDWQRPVRLDNGGRPSPAWDR